MKRRLLLATMVMLGVLSGTALAAFVATTQNTGNTFTTRTIGALPVLSGARITTEADCSPGTVNNAVQQARPFYACLESATHADGIDTVTADLSAVLPGQPGNTEVALSATGGPYSGYAYRSAELTAGVPLATGTTSDWSLRAVNTTGDAKRLTARDVHVRSYTGTLAGEFGAPAALAAGYHFPLGDTGTTAVNALATGTPTAAFVGSPQKDQPGAIVGSSDGAVTLNGTNAYLDVARNGTISGDYTVAAWIKGDASSGHGTGFTWTDAAGLVDAGDPNSDNDFGMGIDATGRVVMGCGTGATLRTGPGLLNDGDWHFVAFTRIAATGHIRVFVDGTQPDSANDCNTTVHDGAPAIWIGRSHQAAPADQYFKGSIDEVTLVPEAVDFTVLRDWFYLGRGL